MFKLHSFLAPAIALTVVACGARFSAHESEGTPGGSAGEASGGFTSAAGSTSIGDAGEQAVGGSSSAGAASIAGAGGTMTGTAGAATGAGGGRNWGSGGGWWTGNGGATAADCETLQEEYQTAVEKARACDRGSTDQCSTSSTAQPIGGCGCPVLINTKSEAASAARKAYQTYLKAGCDRGGPICDIFCGPPTSASCEQSATSGTFVCTAGAFEK